MSASLTNTLYHGCAYNMPTGTTIRFVPVGLFLSVSMYDGSNCFFALYLYDAHRTNVTGVSHECICVEVCLPGTKYRSTRLRLPIHVTPRSKGFSHLDRPASATQRQKNGPVPRQETNTASVAVTATQRLAYTPKNDENRRLRPTMIVGLFLKSLHVTCSFRC